MRSFKRLASRDRRGQSILEVLISVLIALMLWGVVMNLNRSNAHMATTVEEHVSRAAELSRLIRAVRGDVDRIPRVSHEDMVIIRRGGWWMRLPIQESGMVAEGQQIRAPLEWVTYQFDRVAHVLIREDKTGSHRIDLAGVETLRFRKLPPPTRGGRRRLVLEVIHGGGQHREASSHSSVFPYGPQRRGDVEWVSLLSQP